MRAMRCNLDRMKQSATERNGSQASRTPCPNCGADLTTKNEERPGPYLIECPLCRAQIEPVWWQRILWVALGALLSFAIPAFFGMTGWTVFFLAVLFWYPANVAAMTIFFLIFQPVYVRQKQKYTTLFRV